MAKHVIYGTLGSKGLKNCTFSFSLTLFCMNSFFVVFRGIAYKIGPFRLPTHSRDAHRKFVWWSLPKIKIKILAKLVIYGTLGSKGLIVVSKLFLIFFEYYLLWKVTNLVILIFAKGNLFRKFVWWSLPKIKIKILAKLVIYGKRINCCY